MSVIKKIAVAGAVFAAMGYAAVKWDERESFEKTGATLVSQLGDQIIEALSEANETCRTYAKVDSVLFEADGWSVQKGFGTLYISGKNDRAMSINYIGESNAGKVYVKPSDPALAQQSVMQFGIGECQ